MAVETARSRKTDGTASIGLLSQDEVVLTSWSVNLVNEGRGTVASFAQVAGGLTMPAALPYPVRAGGGRSKIG